MENLMRLRTPYPWLAEKGRFIQLARVEKEWLFP
jgi:molecular chaperone DnaK